MKKNGFVFIETIVVVSVLSLTLILLFSSYSYILRKSQDKNVFDTTEMLYKTFYLKKEIDSLKPLSDARTSIDYYIESHLKSNGSICEQMSKYNSFKCDFNRNAGELDPFRIAFEIDKFYVATPSEILSSDEKEVWLNLFDATTIDYIINLGKNSNKRLLIVKYKKVYGEDNYEIYHSSTEV